MLAAIRATHVWSTLGRAGSRHRERWCAPRPQSERDTDCAPLISNATALNRPRCIIWCRGMRPPILPIGCRPEAPRPAVSHSGCSRQVHD